jgi:hypothetical protein
MRSSLIKRGLLFVTTTPFSCIACMFTVVDTEVQMFGEIVYSHRRRLGQDQARLARGSSMIGIGCAPH